MKEHKIVDCDGHVAEPFELFSTHIDPPFRERAPRRIQVNGERRVVVDGKEYPNFVKYGGRPLGAAQDTRIPRPVQNETISKGGVDPHVRLVDMDKEGIDVAILYASGAASMCAVEAPDLESALYRAYNRWLGEYCAADTKRLKGNILVSMRHADLAVQEIKRVGAEPWVGGIMMSGHMDDFNLDDPRLDPIWKAAQEYDLPICIHAGAGRPPYAMGTEECSSNLFLMHSMSHPFEQMRAMASALGGGLLDREPKLRIAFIESGIGWVAWWLDRITEHAKNLPQHVPFMKKEPVEYLSSGRCFVSCLPEEATVEAVIGLLGDDFVVFASDYPHWDCGFPHTVERIRQRRLSDETKRKIFWDNAIKLHTRAL
jgi:predicted TIM-barrel fold metal-dependent hydrolase